MPDLIGQLIAFLRQTVRGDGADPELAGFLVQSAIEASHLPHAEASSIAGAVERFVAGAVDAAARRGELGPETDTAAVTEALTGLVWGAAFQMSRGADRDVPRSERLLDQLELLLQPS